MSYQFFTPTRVLFGVGTLDNFINKRCRGKKALLIISNENQQLKMDI